MIERSERDMSPGDLGTLGSGGGWLITLVSTEGVILNVGVSRVAARNNKPGRLDSSVMIIGALKLWPAS